MSFSEYVYLSTLIVERIFFPLNDLKIIFGCDYSSNVCSNPASCHKSLRNSSFLLLIFDMMARLKLRQFSVFYLPFCICICIFFSCFRSHCITAAMNETSYGGIVDDCVAKFWLAWHRFQHFSQNEKQKKKTETNVNVNWMQFFKWDIFRTTLPFFLFVTHS